MSKRVDIIGQQFGDLLVLEFVGERNTHATYNCLCMLCNETTVKTYSNLKSGNSKSCQRCGKKISNGLEQDILSALKDGISIVQIGKKLNVNRSVIYRIKKH